MKPHKNITKDPNREVKGNRNKPNKPWQLEYRITDTTYFDELKLHYSSFLYRDVEFNVWKKYYFSSKYITPAHAIQQLNKEARTYWTKPWDKDKVNIQELWPFKGKEFRLVNLSTGDIRDIEIDNAEIKLKNGICTSTI